MSFNPKFCDKYNNEHRDLRGNAAKISSPQVPDTQVPSTQETGTQTPGRDLEVPHNGNRPCSAFPTSDQSGPTTAIRFINERPPVDNESGMV